MSDGEILYRGKCSSCHNLIEPSRFDNEKWHLYVKRYGRKMTIQERQFLLNYLTESNQNRLVKDKKPLLK